MFLKSMWRLGGRLTCRQPLLSSLLPPMIEEASFHGIKHFAGWTNTLNYFIVYIPIFLQVCFQTFKTIHLLYYFNIRLFLILITFVFSALILMLICFSSSWSFLILHQRSLSLSESISKSSGNTNRVRFTCLILKCPRWDFLNLSLQFWWHLRPQ